MEEKKGGTTQEMPCSFLKLQVQYKAEEIHPTPHIIQLKIHIIIHVNIILAQEGELTRLTRHFSPWALGLNTPN